MYYHDLPALCACPFCGQPPTLSTEEGMVYCDCGLQAEWPDVETVDEVVAAWNRRTPDTDALAVVAALTAEVEVLRATVAAQAQALEHLTAIVADDDFEYMTTDELRPAARATGQEETNAL